MTEQLIADLVITALVLGYLGREVRALRGIVGELARRVRRVEARVCGSSADDAPTAPERPAAREEDDTARLRALRPRG